MTITPAMRCLQRLVALLDSSPCEAKKGKQYSNKVMVAMHLLATSLCNQREAIKVAQQALEAALGRLLPSDRIAKRLPSASFVAARMVCFDGACMLLKQELEQRFMQDGVTRWLWADSSVQARRDWLQVKELWVERVPLYPKHNPHFPSFPPPPQKKGRAKRLFPSPPPPARSVCFPPFRHSLGFGCALLSYFVVGCTLFMLRADRLASCKISSFALAPPTTTQAGLYCTSMVDLGKSF